MERMHVLHLIDSLESAAARQATQLAEALKHGGDTVALCCLGSETRVAQTLRQTDIQVHALGWSRWLDFTALLRLRELIRSGGFDAIHVWHPAALRALAIVANGCLPRVVATVPYSDEPRPSGSGMTAWWDRWLLDRVVRPNIPAVPLAAPAIKRAVFAEKKTTPDPFSVLCLDGGFRQAVWAFDFLRHACPRVRLRLGGTGSEGPLLRTWTEALGSATSVDILPPDVDRLGTLADADVVWITASDGCSQIALEAMACGTPVVACDALSLYDIVIPGETGFLVPAGDVLQFARLTKLLHDDPLGRGEIGDAARRHVERRHALADVATQWRQIYRAIAA
jgi:hypothetical protein